MNGFMEDHEIDERLVRQYLVAPVEEIAIPNTFARVQPGSRTWRQNGASTLTSTAANLQR